MAMGNVNIGRIGVWYGMIDMLSTPDAQKAAQEIEALGYGALWVAEAVGRDPFVSATLLLSATENLALCTGIANIYARDPMTMSAGHKTVCEAFPNRFLLGLGVSHGHLVAGIRKHDWSKPYSYMVEYLERMRSALFMAKGPDVDGDIVLAALRPRMLELSATAAAGAHPYLTTPAHTADARKILGPDPLLAVEQMVILSTDPEVARRIARAGLAMYIRLPNYVNNLKNYGFTDEDFADGGSDRLVDELVVWGDVDAVTARVKEHLDAGADHVCVQVLHESFDAPIPQLTALAGPLLAL